MAQLAVQGSASPSAARARRGLRRRILLIFNPAAGRRRRPQLESALAELSRRGAVVTLRETTAPGDAEAFAREAEREQFDAIISAGGDGTLNEVINGVGAGSPPVGVLPLGTANVLAAEIGMGRSMGAIAEALLEGAVRPIWPGVVNGRRFAMMAGIGFDAAVVDGVNVMLKRRFGRGAYVLQAARQLMQHRTTMYQIVIDDTPCTAASAIICRGSRYGGRYVCAPGASIFEPWFEVCLFRNAGRLDVLRSAANLWLGRMQSDPNVQTLRAKHIRITGSADPVQCDGNIVCRLPADFTLSNTPVELIAPS